MLFDGSILTRRFEMRSLRVEDATEKYLGWLEDNTARQYIVSASRAWTLDSLRVFIQSMSDREDVLFFGIFERDSGSHVGNIKFEGVDRVDGTCDLGVLIGASEWRGRGVFPEIFASLKEVLHDRYGIKEIHLGVAKANEAAAKSYRKSGFVETDGSYFRDKAAKDAVYMVAKYG